MIFTIIILAVTPINSYLSISMIDYHIHHAQKFGGNNQTAHPAMICAVFHGWHQYSLDSLII